MLGDLKVGLSLGGGGARGLGHVVVLEVIDELGIEIDVMTGSSIGALIGMGYANGMSGREIRANVLDTFSDRTKVFSQLWSLRPANFQDWFNPKSYSFGQIDPKKILHLFTPINGLPERLEDLKTPLHIVATDFYRWEETVFSKGDLTEVVAASIAIPMVFKPVSIDGRIMIDGNITNPLPVDHLPEDVNRVIAVDVVGGPDPEGSDIPSSFDCMLGANQIMMQTITREKLENQAPPDVLIRPPINGFGVLDFLKASTILRLCDTKRDDIKRQIADALNL